MPNREDAFNEIIAKLQSAALAEKSSVPASNAISSMSTAIKSLQSNYRNILDHNQRLASLSPGSYNVTKETQEQRQGLFDAYFMACHEINDSLREMHERDTQFQDHNWKCTHTVNLNFQEIYDLKGLIKDELAVLEEQEERLSQASSHTSAPGIVAPLTQNAEIKELMEAIHSEVGKGIASPSTTPADFLTALKVEDTASEVFNSPTTPAIEAAQKLVAETAMPKSASIPSIEMSAPEAAHAPEHKSWLGRLGELLSKFVAAVVSAVKSVFGSNPTSDYKQELRRNTMTGDDTPSSELPTPTKL